MAGAAPLKGTNVGFASMIELNSSPQVNVITLDEGLCQYLARLGQDWGGIDIRVACKTPTKSLKD